MLNKESITKSSLPKVRQDYIVVAPNQLLRPYIAKLHLHQSQHNVRTANDTAYDQYNAGLHLSGWSIYRRLARCQHSTNDDRKLRAAI